MINGYNCTVGKETTAAPIGPVLWFTCTSVHQHNNYDYTCTVGKETTAAAIESGIAWSFTVAADPNKFVYKNALY